MSQTPERTKQLLGMAIELNETMLLTAIREGNITEISSNLLALVRNHGYRQALEDIESGEVEI